MNVPTLTMPVEEAKAAYREYRKHLGPNPEARDQAVLLGYRALSKGHAILDLHDALRKGGLDERHRPKLAFAPADWREVFFAADWNGRAAFGPSIRVAAIHAGRRQGCLPRTAFAAGVFPREVSGCRPCRALVPLIPPRLRPQTALARYCVLWEAAWESPPTDPLLLRHLTGRLYAVLAAWDLTPLERLVLGAVPAQNV